MDRFLVAIFFAAQLIFLTCTMVAVAVVFAFILGGIITFVESLGAIYPMSHLTAIVITCGGFMGVVGFLFGWFFDE